MDKQGIDRIRKALTGAEGERLAKREAAAARDFDDGGAKARRAGGRLARKSLAAGKAAGRFEKLVTAQLARAAERSRKWKAAAIKGSAAGATLLDGRRASLIRSLEVLAETDPTVPSPEYHLLNTPFLIWPTNSVDLEASEIVPSNSWARFRARIGSHKSFFGDVKFYYLWDNPTDKFAVINANGYSIFHGTAFVGVGGGVFPANRAASVKLTASLQILEWWNQPPTQPFSQQDQSAEILNLKVSAGGFWEVGALDLRNVFRGSDLRHTLLLVPPRGVVVFVVSTAVVLGTGDDDGLAEVDFASGDFMVGSPAVLVTVLT